MKREELLAIKSMVFAQAFIDVMDEFEGSSAFKHRLKNKGLSFIREVDHFLGAAYCGGDTDMGVLGLIEECQRSIGAIVEESVEVVE